MTCQDEQHSEVSEPESVTRAAKRGQRNHQIIQTFLLSRLAQASLGHSPCLAARVTSFAVSLAQTLERKGETNNLKITAVLKPLIFGFFNVCYFALFFYFFYFYYYYLLLFSKKNWGGGRGLHLWNLAVLLILTWWDLRLNRTYLPRNITLEICRLLAS